MYRKFFHSGPVNPFEDFKKRLERTPMPSIKYKLLTVVLLAAWSPAALAQNDAAGTTASANVIATNIVEKTANLDFSENVEGSTKFMDADNQSVSTTNGVTGNETFGVVDIEVATGQKFDVDLQFPTALTGQTDNNNTLPVDFSADGSGGTGANAIIISAAANQASYNGGVDANVGPIGGGTKTDWSGSGNSYTINNFGNSSVGSYKVVIGGKVTAANDQANEQYQGDLTITVTLTE